MNHNPMHEKSPLAQILAVSTRLGLTSFGGPAAHLGYFYEEYVRRKKWVDERTYADLVALCQFLPGPASSQVGIGIGLLRGGLPGAIAAWLGFTLPSVLLLVVFAWLYQGFDAGESAGWIHGLKIAAVAVVAHAVRGMGQSLASGRVKATIAIVTAVAAIGWPSVWTQVALIAAAGAAGFVLIKHKEGEGERAGMPIRISRKLAAGALIAFFTLLAVLPLLRSISSLQSLALFDSFYRSGALVFGGGHVVLPLLEREVVPPGWLTQEQFLAGYGAAQAVPGPLFTFASYVGAAAFGWIGALIATVAVFLPAFLLVIGVLPFWGSLGRYSAVQRAVSGINAAVVGLLLAALYNPVWTSAVRSPSDFALALLAFGMLIFWKLPPWAIVIFCAVGGWALSLAG